MDKAVQDDWCATCTCVPLWLHVARVDVSVQVRYLNHDLEVKNDA